jgi:cysteine-rich repeat protein
MNQFIILNLIFVVLFSSCDPLKKRNSLPLVLLSNESSNSKSTIVNNPSSKDILSFGFNSPSTTGTINGDNITVIVPYATNLNSLVAVFTTTGKSINILSVNQTSGITSNNFSTPKTYTVVAQDLSTKNYTVNVIAGQGYSIGGNLTSLSSGSVTFFLNGANSIIRNATGTFTFGTLLGTASNYTITATPSNGTVVCSLLNSSGTIANSNISNLSASCIAPICGNGIIESGEQCDDADTFSGDGCSSLCQIELVSGGGGFYNCVGQPSVCYP